MAKFTEDQLISYTKPPSKTEETKLKNSESSVRDAISSNEKLKKKSTETFGQGSYANKTNVRLNSDIDINVCYTGGFFYTLPKEKTKEELGLTNPATYTYTEFKDDVEQALVDKFGRSDVKRNDKCITIVASSTRIETDVVPTWEYRRFKNNGSYTTGTKFRTDKSKWIENFPKQHIANGIDKNSKTSRRFKRLTRLHRKLRYKMIDDGENVSDNITSFLLECLVWNTPNRIMNDYDTWEKRLKESINYIYQNTKEQVDCKEWGEVSELFYLFHSERKWSYSDVNNYMQELWNYLEY
ncbi:nucleotidyltransferase domain-containing protein [Winogradskyella vidalii]|uniref:nucleotidyltransferase domain-containing protein n=1 Tax=Winogradskyella vidalii TaxID=2615024 RepID=UPI0015CC2BB6|nr:nucleotidyltransferase [Winogradskyella vidalii]